jgi:hypothetical protein
MRSTLNSLIESQMKSNVGSAKPKKRHLEDSNEDSKSKRIKPDGDK